MKTDKNTKDLDILLMRKLQAELPEAPENLWFTRRVINRLPDHRSFAGRVVQVLCYVLSALVSVGGIWFSVDNLISNGFSLQSLVLLMCVPVMIISSLMIALVPTLKKVMDGE